MRNTKWMDLRLINLLEQLSSLPEFNGVCIVQYLVFNVPLFVFWSFLAHLAQRAM